MLATRGAPRIIGSLGAAALIAGIAFARCNSSGITGPKSTLSSTQGTGLPRNGGSGKDLGTPTKGGPIRLQMAMLPATNPCTGQGVLWDPTQSFTMAQSTIQAGTDGALHAQFHLNSQAQGSTDPANNLNALPTLQYNGGQQYDSQDMVFVTGNEHYKLEWNIKIIAKGNDGTIFDDDDFFLHLVMDTPLDVTQASTTTSTYCR